MALKPLISFSSGELDPALHDFTTLQKFDKGLETGRNIMIGKTGSIMSRFSRAHFSKSKNDAEKIYLFCPKNSTVVTEWGPLYVRGYNFSGSVLYTTTHAYTAADLEIIQFTSDPTSIYATVKGKDSFKMNYTTGVDNSSTMFKIATHITAVTPSTSGTPSGYDVDYQFVPVVNGELCIGVGVSRLQLPDAVGDFNIFTITHSATVEEILVYRRPYLGGEYGFIGSAQITIGAISSVYNDQGGDADYTNNPWSALEKNTFSYATGVFTLKPASSVIYQQRLILGNLVGDLEEILASRPWYKNNFSINHPYDSSSALKFKAGTSGTAEVLRMLDNNGLIVFTTAGIYTNVGPLNPDNASLENRGPWVINSKIPPLAVPGGVFFVDVSTNTIRKFVYSDTIATYEGIDVSIFSDHLFRKRTVVSWAFQNGVIPIIIVVFSDGTFATLTYQAEQQMQAWTRHDSVYPIEQVEKTSTADATFFVVNKNGNRYIEVSLPRIIPSDTYVANPEADKLNLNTFMDSIKSTSNLLNNSFTGVNKFVLTPVTSGVWDGNLTLTCGTQALFPSPGLGVVGTIFRFFDLFDQSIVDLQVISRASNNQVVVSPSCLFPSAQADNFRLYQTYNQVTGLTHLEGETVSVVVDGGVVGSPNNDQEIYPAMVVTSGTITLPNNERGAIIIVGRPITADIKTLNISTVEQGPTTLESINVAKLYIRVHESRGVYVSNKFPEEKMGLKDGHSVLEMEDLYEYDIPDGYDITGNKPQPPVSKRIERTLLGEWKSNGKISLRQVDPVHFEILSIIPDMDVLTRQGN